MSRSPIPPVERRLPAALRARSLIIALIVVAIVVAAIWVGGGWLWEQFLAMHSPHGR
jgi:hypothetical protein